MDTPGTFYIGYPSRKSEIVLYFVGDLHIGNIAVSKSKLNAIRNEILSADNHFVIGMGDYADYINFDDKRFRSQIADFTIEQAGSLGLELTRQVKEFFEPFKDRILGLCWGNHEEKYFASKQQYQLHQWLCTELGVPNFGYSALFDIVFVRPCKLRLIRPPNMLNGNNKSKWSVRLFVHHGAGCAITSSGRSRTLERLMELTDADITVAAHLHGAKVESKVRLTLSGKRKDKLSEKRIFGALTGAYLRSYAEGLTTYSERKAYYPTVLGSTKIVIQPDKEDIQVIVP